MIRKYIHIWRKLYMKVKSMYMRAVTGLQKI